MLSMFSSERAVRRSDTDSVHPATLSDRSLAAPQAMIITGWQKQTATGVIPASSDRPTAG